MSAGVRFLYRAIRTSPGVGNGEQIPAQASARHLYSTIREIKGVIFDMDGTLTLPVLNFLEMRTRLGIPRGADILPTVLKMPREERERALNIIEELEDEGWYSAAWPHYAKECVFPSHRHVQTHAVHVHTLLTDSVYESGSCAFISPPLCVQALGGCSYSLGYWSCSNCWHSTASREQS